LLADRLLSAEKVIEQGDALTDMLMVQGGEAMLSKGADALCSIGSAAVESGLVSKDVLKEVMGDAFGGMQEEVAAEFGGDVGVGMICLAVKDAVIGALELSEEQQVMMTSVEVTATSNFPALLRLTSSPTLTARQEAERAAQGAAGAVHILRIPAVNSLYVNPCC